MLLAGGLLAMADAGGLGPAKSRATFELSLCLALAVVGILVVLPARRLRSATGLAAAVVFVGFEAVQTQHPVAIYGHGRWLTVAEMVAAVLPALGLVIAVAADNVARIAYRVLLALFTLGGVAVIRSSPRPSIDVWYLLQHATSCLTHGCNPYAMHTPASPQLKDGFPYLPGTAYVLTPFHVVLGDARYGEVAALLVGAVLLTRMIGGQWGKVAAALALSVPCTLFSIEQAWIEPLLFAALVAVAWAWRANRSVALVVLLALAFTLKQHAILLAPLALGMLGWRRTLAAGGAAAAVSAPLVFLNFHAFWETAVKVFYDLPPRTDSLSIWLDASPSIRPWLPYVLLAAGYALIGLRMPWTPAGWLVGSGLLLGLFDLGNKFSFFNEWWLPAVLLAAGAAASVCIVDREVST